MPEISSSEPFHRRLLYRKKTMTAPTHIDFAVVVCRSVLCSVMHSYFAVLQLSGLELVRAYAQTDLPDTGADAHSPSPSTGAKRASLALQLLPTNHYFVFFLLGIVARHLKFAVLVVVVVRGVCVISFLILCSSSLVKRFIGFPSVGDEICTRGSHRWLVCILFVAKLNYLNYIYTFIYLCM